MNYTQKDKVSQIKEELGRGWWSYIMENTGKSHRFVSKMVNGLETHRPEWQWVIQRIKDQKALKAKNEAATDEILANPDQETEKILA